MKDPAFLFYSDNFLSGTMFFTDEQTGKYIRLLCAQHLTGHLEEKHMIFICKGRDEDIFSKFVKDSDGKYYNERLELEINKRLKYSESRSNNKKGKVKSYDLHMGNGNGNGNGFRIPSLLEVESYFKEKGYNKTGAEKFFNYYTETGWKDKDGKPIAKWKLKAVNVWFRDEYKIKENQMVY